VRRLGSKWQHRALTVSLNPSTNAQNEAGTAAITAFEVFGMTQQEIEHGFPVSRDTCSIPRSLGRFSSVNSMYCATKTLETEKHPTHK